MNNRTGITLAAGIAAIALMSSHAGLAQGNGNGKGNAGGDNRGGSPQAKQDKERPGDGQSGNGNGKRDQNPSAKDGAGKGRASDRQYDNRGNGKGANGIGIRGNDNRGNDNRGNGNQSVRVRSRDGNDLDVGFALPQLRQILARETRVINGCPPGLAKKRNGCLPPGQAQKSYRSYDPSFFGLNGIGSGRYFYDDGYLLSYRGDGLAGYLPLLGGALGIGNVWPSSYAPQPLPDYYSSYYGLSDPRGYRFADNVIYRVNPETSAIASVAALLTGDDVTIGQPMPVGYDVYNVPYPYRDRYADDQSARYRYADGYVYQVDPKSALVVAAIDLVT